MKAINCILMIAEVLALTLGGFAVCLQWAGAIAQPLWLVLSPFWIVGAARCCWTCLVGSFATAEVLSRRSQLETRWIQAPRAERRRRRRS
jgi:hypothetical protein